MGCISNLLYIVIKRRKNVIEGIKLPNLETKQLFFFSSTCPFLILFCFFDMIGKLLNKRSLFSSGKINNLSNESIRKGKSFRRTYTTLELDETQTFLKGFDLKNYIKKDASQNEILKEFWRILNPALGEWTPSISQKVYNLKNVPSNALDTLTGDQLNYLGLQYQYGLNGYTSDRNQAENLYKASYAKGDSGGLCNLAIVSVLNGRYDESYNLFKRAAESDNNWALLNLSKMKADGYHGHSYDESMIYLNESSLHGNYVSSLKIAYNLISRTSDVSLARVSSERALSQCPGLEPALTLLGRSMLATPDADKNVALSALRAADEYGDADAPFFLSQYEENLNEKQKEEYLLKSIERRSSYGQFVQYLRVLMEEMEKENLDEASSALMKLLAISEWANTPDLSLRLADVLIGLEFPLYKKFAERIYLDAVKKGSLEACHNLLEYYKKEYGEFSDEAFQILSVGGRFYRDFVLLEELKEYYKEGPRKDSVIYNSLVEDIAELKLFQTAEGRVASFNKTFENINKK